MKRLAALALPLLFACGGASEAGRGATSASRAAIPATMEVAGPPVATAQTEPPPRVQPEVHEKNQDEVRFCTFQQGQLQVCRTAYSGSIQLWEEGVWLNCRVTAGRVTHCLGPGGGNIVTFDGSHFVQCVVASGSLVGCQGPFTGSAALARPPVKD